MACIWRHPKSKYWTARFTGSDGTRVNRSTKKTNRKDAATIADEWERAAAKGRDRELTETQCRDVLNSILEKTTGEQFRSSSTEDFLRGWLKGKGGSKSEGTHTRYSHSIELFLDGLGPRRQQRITAIIPRDVERFRDAEIKAGKAPSTVNVDLKTLRTAFNWALRQNLIQSNPVLAVEFPDEERHQRGAFTPEQLHAIVKTSKGEWRTAIMFGYYVGARLGDAVQMRAENIDLPGKRITYTQSKTGKVVECPLHSALESYLLALPAGDNPKALITPTLAEKEVGGRNGLSREFKEIMKAARVDDGRIESNGSKKGRAFCALTFHSLRHGFVSDLANKGVAEEIRMKLTGHTNNKVHSGYTKLQMDPLRKAISNLPDVLKGAK